MQKPRRRQKKMAQMAKKRRRKKMNLQLQEVKLGRDGLGKSRKEL